MKLKKYIFKFKQMNKEIKLIFYFLTNDDPILIVNFLLIFYLTKRKILIILRISIYLNYGVKIVCKINNYNLIVLLSIIWLYLLDYCYPIIRFKFFQIK